MARSATDLQQINGFATMIPITIANLVTVVLVAIVLLAVSYTHLDVYKRQPLSRATGR